jgi:hypothetical protein
MPAYLCSVHGGMSISTPRGAQCQMLASGRGSWAADAILGQCLPAYRLRPPSGKSPISRPRNSTPEQVERRRRMARDLDLGHFLPKGYHRPGWTKDEVTLHAGQ